MELFFINRKVIHKITFLFSWPLSNELDHIGGKLPHPSQLEGSDISWICKFRRLPTEDLHIIVTTLIYKKHYFLIILNKILGS